MTRPQIGGQTAFQSPRTFAPNRRKEPVQQQRAFGAAGVAQPGDQTGRRFGAPGELPRGNGPSQPRGFGSFGSRDAPQEERHFGDAIPAGERHFGEARGPPERSFGDDRSFHETGGEVRRSPSGRVFRYQGHEYQRFAAPRYAWPHGYAYRRYAIGRRLPRAFWVHDYYIDNYDEYELAPPPPDFEWIRYGPDILLIDLDTGEIAQVVYGAFDEIDAPTPDE
jgi:Ni/Co efflux regulator RcnB